MQQERAGGEALSLHTTTAASQPHAFAHGPAQTRMSVQGAVDGAPVVRVLLVPSDGGVDALVPRHSRRPAQLLDGGVVNVVPPVVEVAVRNVFDVLLS